MNIAQYWKDRFDKAEARNAELLDALRTVAAYPVHVEGYNSVSAVRLRLVAVQTIAREAIAKAIEVQS